MKSRCTRIKRRQKNVHRPCGTWSASLTFIPCAMYACTTSCTCNVSGGNDLKPSSRVRRHARKALQVRVTAQDPEVRTASTLFPRYEEGKRKNELDAEGISKQTRKVSKRAVADGHPSVRATIESPYKTLLQLGRHRSTSGVSEVGIVFGRYRDSGLYRRH